MSTKANHMAKEFLDDSGKALSSEMWQEKPIKSEGVAAFAFIMRFTAKTALCPPGEELRHVATEGSQSFSWA